MINFLSSFLSLRHVLAARACVPVYDKAMLVAFYFIENNTHLTLEGARGFTAVPLKISQNHHTASSSPNLHDQHILTILTL